MEAEPHRDQKIGWATLAMAGFATIALDQATLEPGRPRALALAGSAGILVVPALVAARGLLRRAPEPGDRLSAPADPWRRSTAGLALLALFALPFAWETGRLVVTGRAAMAEITLMAALRNLGLGLSAMAYKVVYSRLSALVSLFLATVASSLGGEGGVAVLAPLGGFALDGMLWLILVYWEGLGLERSAPSGERRLPVSAVACALALIAVPAVVMAVGPSRAATALAALVPTSGGTDGNDPDARSGVGDGDNEVSASEHPQSVGFTDSEIYLETDRPSLYDSFTETYGEPLKPRKQEKMIALGLQDFSEQKERPAENLAAGREFSALRRKPESRPRKPGERAARALVYVKGPTPLHLPLTSFSHFDGTTWREEPCCNRPFPAEREPTGTWLRLPILELPFLAGSVVHQVKIGTLDSSTMPVPPHLMRFRVGSVARLDFFGWAQFGFVRMTGRTVPAGTVIDSEARTIDPLRLRSYPIWAHQTRNDDHFLSFEGTYAIDPRVAALAERMVAGQREGWCRIEAVIAAVREGYTHDRSATAPAGCTDVVAEFLLHSRHGPDYLFASAAAVLLRSLGYPTRVVSGLYAAPGRYDPRTRHTPVTTDDIHFWAEVRLPSGLWVAVEPTPGYELLPPVRALSEQIAQAIADAGRWASHHAAMLLATLVSLVVIFLRRHALLDRAATIAFRLIPAGDSRRFVMRSLMLIERRARWAGRTRPAGLTPARWYGPVAHQAGHEARVALEGLVRLADWAIHAPEQIGPPTSPAAHDIQCTCRSAVSAWTLAHFRVLAPDHQPGKAATT